MDFYEKNMESIRFHYPELAKALSDEDINQDKEIQIECIETRDDASALIVEKEGKKYRLNSAYHPLSEAEKWTEQYDVNSIQMLVVMFGFGNGIFARSLLSRLQSDAHFLVWEPNFLIFRYVLQCEDLTDLLLDARFFIGVGEKVLKNILRFERLFIIFHRQSYVIIFVIKICVRRRQSCFIKQFPSNLV